MRCTIALFVLLLVGCAKEGGWTKSDATEQGFHMDKGECGSKAFAAPTSFQQQAIFITCMHGKGWYWQEKP